MRSARVARHQRARRSVRPGRLRADRRRRTDRVRPDRRAGQQCRRAQCRSGRAVLADRRRRVAAHVAHQHRRRVPDDARGGAAMIAQKFGRIVNVSTERSHDGAQALLALRAVEGLPGGGSRIWAQDLAGTGVTVNVLLPGGAVDTAADVTGVATPGRTFQPASVMVPPTPVARVRRVERAHRRALRRQPLGREPAARRADRGGARQRRRGAAHHVSLDCIADPTGWLAIATRPSGPCVPPPAARSCRLDRRSPRGCIPACPARSTPVARPRVSTPCVRLRSGPCQRR